MPTQFRRPLGWLIIRTPAKPIMTAIQRSRPTRSRRIGQDSAVSNSGEVKVSDTASASGSKW